jgi:hypothetical protein
MGVASSSVGDSDHQISTGRFSTLVEKGCRKNWLADLSKFIDDDFLENYHVWAVNYEKDSAYQSSQQPFAFGRRLATSPHSILSSSSYTPYMVRNCLPHPAPRNGMGVFFCITYIEVSSPLDLTMSDPLIAN